MKEEEAIGCESRGEISNEEIDFEDNKGEEQRGGDECVLKFLDSMDTYLTLIDDLSSSLRQGWLDLASAKHSMGASRINTAMLDLKVHSASTTLQVSHHHAGSMEKEPHFSLCKWGSLESTGEDKLQKKSGSPQLRHRGHTQLSGEKASADVTLSKVDDKFEFQVQKERSKSLSVFGTLVSPKLRSSQLAFEAVLEKLVEIANMRSAILSSSDQIKKELDYTKRTT